MKKIPDAEFELMQIIWSFDKPVTRVEITDKMDSDKEIVPSTILTLLSRLEKRGFVSVEKKGKINYYTPLVSKELYLKETSKNILERMFEGSLANFITALYSGKEMTESDIKELEKFIEGKTKQ